MYRGVFELNRDFGMIEAGRMPKNQVKDYDNGVDFKVGDYLKMKVKDLKRIGFRSQVKERFGNNFRRELIVEIENVSDQNVRWGNASSVLGGSSIKVYNDVTMAVECMGYDRIGRKLAEEGLFVLKPQEKMILRFVSLRKNTIASLEKMKTKAVLWHFEYFSIGEGAIYQGDFQLCSPETFK